MINDSFRRHILKEIQSYNSLRDLNQDNSADPAIRTERPKYGAVIKWISTAAKCLVPHKGAHDQENGSRFIFYSLALLRMNVVTRYKLLKLNVTLQCAG